MGTIPKLLRKRPIYLFIGHWLAVLGLPALAGCASGVAAPPTVGPTAIANAVTTAPVGQTITLNGSQSTDASNLFLTYRWTQTSGPATVVIDNATSSVAAFTPIVSGIYTFMLIVTDAQGLSDSDTVSVTVTATAGGQTSLIARIAAPATASVGSTIILDGSGSQSIGGQITQYIWDQINGPPTVLVQNITNPIATAPLNTAGIYIFRLTVRDTNNLVSTASATVQTTGTATAP